MMFKNVSSAGRAAFERFNAITQPAEPAHTIGVYLTAQGAWGARRDAEGRWRRLSELDAVAEPTDPPLSLPQRLGRALRPLAADSLIYIALDSRFFTQYALTSEFEDIRQIESTLKFDLEEPAAADATTLTACFWLHSQHAGATALTAFAADRQTLTDIVLELQESGIDPVAIEPDAVCLARLADKALKLSDHPDQFYLLAAEGAAYWILPPTAAGFAPHTRSALLPQSGDITALLVRQALQELAGWDNKPPLRRLVILQNAPNADLAALARQTGLEVTVEKISSRLALPEPDNPQTMPAMLFSVGAAMAAEQKTLTTDFRRDFMPYKGKRRQIESSLRLAGVFAAILLLAVGLFFQFKTMRANYYSRQLQSKLAGEYRAAMYGANPPSSEPVVSRLRRAVANAKRAQEGLGGGDDKSVPARLTFLLEAVNGLSPSADVAIQQIAITERSMRVKGDTNSRQSTLELFEAVKKHPKLRIASERMGMVGNRDAFEFTIEPEK